MSAHADDLRYFYAETLGDTIEVTVPAAASTKLRDTEKLSPGRYMLRIVAFGAGVTSVWARFGKHEDVEAAASAPSTRFVADTAPGTLNRPLLFFMVRQGEDEANQLAFFAEGGANTIVQVTKVSRDKH